MLGVVLGTGYIEWKKNQICSHFLISSSETVGASSAQSSKTMICTFSGQAIAFPEDIVS